MTAAGPGVDPARYVHVACPRCGADSAKERLRLVVSAIVTCGECGLSYVDPRVPASHIEEKLQAWAEQDVVDGERLAVAFAPGNLEHYGRLVRALGRHGGGGRRLLDVGCATGAFLTVARDAGWQARGIEVGRASAAYAREQLGLDVRNESLYELAGQDGSCDAVALLEVIEHLERPPDALRSIAGLLAPGGLLLLTTPNFDSLYRRLFGARWWVVNCEDEHIVLFNRASLGGLLEDCGFEPLSWSIRGLDLAGMAREARRALRGRGRPGGEAAPANALEGYYESRASHLRLRSALDRLGVLAAAKALLRALDRTFAWRFSPTYAWGEQLIVIARKRG